MTDIRYTRFINVRGHRKTDLQSGPTWAGSASEGWHRPWDDAICDACGTHSPELGAYDRAVSVRVLSRVILSDLTHRVGPKGQVVIPKDMRDRLGISPSSEVVFTQMDDGVLVRAATGLAALRGMLAGSGLTAELQRARDDDAEIDRARE